MPARPVVANNTPLVAFWSIQRLDILRQLFDEILIPPVVQEEFLAVDTHLRLQELKEATWIKAVDLVEPESAVVFAGLDRGEAEVLALAQERDARLVLVDELKARRYAQRIGLSVSGTVGILLLAKEDGLIEKISPLLFGIIDAGLYIHPNLLNRALELAGEGQSS